MKIEYRERYSSTNEPDEMGRWSRSAIYKGILIAWISRHENELGVKYLASLEFPTKATDCPSEATCFDTYEEAQSFVKKRFIWFRNKLA
jgi:hypothetical protein